MRRAIALASILLTLPASAYAEDIVLKFWDNQQTESGLSQYQKEAVKSFEAANPGIKVEVTTIPYPEYQQRLLTAVQGGNAPDVSTIDQIWVAAFAEAGAIEPLDDLAKKSGITANAFFPGAWASANYGGKLWGIPFNVDVWQFSFYNADLLKAAGVEPQSIATFEGLAAAGKKLKVGDITHWGYYPGRLRSVSEYIKGTGIRGIMVVRPVESAGAGAVVPAAGAPN